MLIIMMVIAAYIFLFLTFMEPPGSTKEMEGLASKVAMALVYSIWGRISNFVWDESEVLKRGKKGVKKVIFLVKLTVTHKK